MTGTIISGKQIETLGQFMMQLVTNRDTSNSWEGDSSIASI